MKDTDLIYNYSREMEHEKWRKEIPYLKFPSDYEVQITPPFAGAVVRFCIKKQDVHVSVYLDCYSQLGAVSVPYWEIYPHDNDCFRCEMNDTEGLLKAIEESINQRL